MAAAAALRSAARKVCARAFERPQAYFTTAASAALKEEQRRLLPRISLGGSSVRRFSSSESPNVLKNKGAKLEATSADDVVGIPLSPWSPRHPYHKHVVATWAAGTIALCSAIFYGGTNYVSKRERFVMENIFKRHTLAVDRDCRQSKDGSC